MQAKDDQSGGRPIQSMDRIHVRAKLIPQRLKQKRLARRRPRATMDHQASWLVYRNVMFVAKDDLEGLR
jgi:hypothetical protein